MLFPFLNYLPNEIIWLVFALVNFIGITIFYKFFGKTGLFVWIGFGTVIANIQVLEYLEFFGITATLGNIMYGTLFLATDSLNEKYGKDEAKQAVWLGFLTLVSMVIIMQVAIQFNPHVIDEAQPHLIWIFNLIPRIALGSLVAYLVSQFFDVYFFHRIKRKYSSDLLLWLRNNGSTIVSQLIDSVIFVSIAFLGALPFSEWFEILITTYIIKVIVAALDTPFIYWIKKIKPINEK
ncbi:queuosine precursor transporter [Mycoplasmatota bacterium]|nr:queuosine precursor transporter [Mycoplasmatota bacterium]